MATRNPQTMAKRAREQAVKERRERKQAKRAAVRAARISGDDVATGGEQEATDELHDAPPDAGE